MERKEEKNSFEIVNEKCWPLLSPAKVELQKCEKCSREFCSSVNYRRHIRVHRRTSKNDKDFLKNRGYLGAFWDKIALEEAKEIISLADIAIEGIYGPTIIKALSLWIHKPGYASLPNAYIKAGNNLLEIVQEKPYVLPVSSKELFKILDDASENTFMCAGMADSLEKYLFDGGAEKIVLEMKNLAACISYLLEQKLVKAWVADKAAEALKCQKLLVEEEEAKQKRQAELAEKKRMKRLRQRERKLKDSNPNLTARAADSEMSDSPEAIHVVRQIVLSGQEVKTSVTVTNIMLEPCYLQEADPSSTAQSAEYESSCSQEAIHVVNPIVLSYQKVKPAVTMCNLQKKNPSLTAPSAEAELFDSREGIHVLSQIVPSDQKVKPLITNIIQESCDLQEEADLSSTAQSVESESCDSQEALHVVNQTVLSDEKAKPYNNLVDPPEKLEVIIGSISVAVDPHRENSDKSLTIKIGERESNNSEDYVNSDADDGCSLDLSGLLPFSSKVVAAFLAQRWREAIASDHVMLVLPPETEASDPDLLNSNNNNNNK